VLHKSGPDRDRIVVEQKREVRHVRDPSFICKMVAAFDSPCEVRSGAAVVDCKCAKFGAPSPVFGLSATVQMAPSAILADSRTSEGPLDCHPTPGTSPLHSWRWVLDVCQAKHSA